MNQPTTSSVPAALRTAFVVHFWADIAFAVPLLVAPEALLGLLGWQQVDPIAARLVAAALFGVGIESYRARDASADQYRTMLDLKVIWSFAALLGVALSLLQGAQGRPLGAWLVLVIFAAFHGLWVYWWRRLRAQAPTVPAPLDP